MPTYRNDGSGVVWYAGTDGNSYPAAPGETFETYVFRNDAGLVQTSTLPLWKPTASQITVTNDTGGVKVLEADLGYGIKKAWVSVNDSGITVDVYLQTTAGNIPVVAGLTYALGTHEITINRRATKLKLRFSGDGSATVTPWPETK